MQTKHINRRSLAFIFINAAGYSMGLKLNNVKTLEGTETEPERLTVQFKDTDEQTLSKINSFKDTLMRVSNETSFIRIEDLFGHPTPREIAIPEPEVINARKTIDLKIEINESTLTKCIKGFLIPNFEDIKSPIPDDTFKLMAYEYFLNP